MRLGVLARSEARGLANQSHDVCLNLDPDRVLLIDPGRDKRFTQHPERYEQWPTTTALWRNGRLDPDVVRPWLQGLDVVYSAETPYDDRLPQWAAEAGCGIVVHANPEFLNPHDAKAAVTWWAATPWRIEHLPARTRVVPTPCPEAPFRHEPGGNVRFLHVAGWPAVADRNGTGIVAESANLMRSGAEVVIRGQHRDIARYRRSNLRVEAGNVPDHWDLYRDADALVMPRRFGGLCLPALEAMAVGLPVVMSDTSPNEVWPGPRVQVTRTQTVATRCGVIPLYDTDPHAFAATLDDIATQSDVLTKLRQEATEWAHANSWGQLRDLWLDELAKACW
jgi:glycosyltransferase involved in cell wall biosynthesis